MTVTALPTQEAYLTRYQLAEKLEVSVTTIDRWRHEGLPSFVWGRRTRRFLLSEAKLWATREGKR